jgi:AcrR family transcriptional regulator
MNEPDGTKERLIAEARNLFAKKGFDGVGVREITRAAHANLGAVTYHFGSKRALYDAALVTMGDDLASRLEAAAATPGSTTDRLQAIVRALFAFFREAPDSPLLILHEVSAAGAPPPALVPLIRRNLQAMDRVLCDGRARGEVGAVEPMMVAFSMIAQSVWFTLVGRFLPSIGAVPADDGSFAARVEAHVAEVVRRSVLPETDMP